MARRRSNSLFLVLNVIISLSVALLVITLYSARQQEEEPRARPTIILVVTATPDPRQPLSADALQATVDSQAGTIIAYERELAQAAVQSNSETVAQQPSAAASVGVSESDAALPTIDPTLIPPLPKTVEVGAGGGIGATAELPADGCQRYFVQSGDTAGAIATRFEVSLSELFVLNGINDQTILQIGQELLIPGESCNPPVTPTATLTPRPTFNLTLVAPTATLPIIETNSQVKIVRVSNPGDITAEQVEIQNEGGEINLLGWKLSDSQGNIYTFPDVRLVPGSVIRVSTRTGTNTPGFLYWNQNSPVWQNGEAATLSNATGVVQSVFTVGGEVIELDGTETPSP